MMPDVPADFWDEHGRGPMLRGWQERHGDRPHLPGPGVAAMLFMVRDSVDKAAEFPEQFKAMLTRAVAEVTAPLQKEVADMRATLEAARRAYAELKAEVVELRKVARPMNGHARVRQ
jgi:hypothetical protein